MYYSNEFVRKMDNNKLKDFLLSLLDYYITPSFGYVKQREFDIYLFYLLKQYSFFEDEELTVFAVISKLQVTRSKAKSLIYESNLRFGKDKLDNRIKEELKCAKFLKMDNSMIGLDIEVPLLIDFLKDKLKKLGHPSDASYSNQILKITIDAYISLLDLYLELYVKEKIINELIKSKLIQNKSFKDAAKLIFRGLSRKALGSASDELIDEYIAPLFESSSNVINAIKNIIEKIKWC